MGMILYHDEPNGPSLTVLAALEESGLDIECRRIDLLGGERHRLPGLRNRTAIDMGVEGEGPVLVVDGEAMTESVFIAQFLDECGAGTLQPADPYARWQMLMLCRRITERVAPAAAYLGSMAYSHALLSAEGSAEFEQRLAGITSPDLRQRWHDLRDGNFPVEVIDDSRAKITDSLDNVEQQLADGREWAMGPFSIVDLVAFGWQAGMRELVPGAFTGRPLTGALFDRIAARPSVKRALARSNVAEPLKSWAPGPEINRWG